jgi:hypothetical protein
MLMIDSMSAFHWPGRWSAEQATPTGTGNVDRLLQHVLDAIQTLRSRLGLITVLTNWALIPNAPSSRVNPTLQLPSSRPYFKQHLLQPYPAPFTPNASVQGTGTTKIMSSLSITHHITLIPVPSTTNVAGSGPEFNLTHIAAHIRTPVPEPQNNAPVSRTSTLSHARMTHEQNKQPSVVEGELEFDIGPDGIAWYQ